MKLYRHLTSFIEEYYATQKSALMLTGARQTGKTYAIRQFGKNFKRFVEINFVERPEAVALFDKVCSADEIFLRLSALVDEPLIEGETLIFFDEVQECENIVTAIKFLVDEGSYSYALSGSLLGVELKNLRSVPVGYLGVKEVFPLDFEEFALNLGVAQRVMDHVRECWEKVSPVDAIVHEQLLSLFRLYTIIGGMPAAVERYIATNDLNVVVQTQRDIIHQYKKDIAKYADKDKLKIKEIYDLIPSELDAKNKRFILKSLNRNAKFDRYENDFLWLKNACVAIPVFNVSAPVMPLKLAVTRNLFKLFSNDVGLLSAQYADGIRIKILSGEVNINYGAVFENVVAQELKSHDFETCYYNSKKMGELDFVISDGADVIPIEVKSGKDFARHSALSNVMACSDYSISKAYVLCTANMSEKNGIVYAPVYMTMFIRHSTMSDGIYSIDLSALR